MERGSTQFLPELSGKNTKQDSDGQRQVKSNHPFQEIHIAVDFGNACLVIGHGPCGGSRFLFAGSCFDQCIVDFLDEHITVSRPRDLHLDLHTCRLYQQRIDLLDEASKGIFGPESKLLASVFYSCQKYSTYNVSKMAEKPRYL